MISFGSTQSHYADWNEAGKNYDPLVTGSGDGAGGEPCGNRTRDPLIKSQVLYQLS
jgi:hypothetical protein